MVEVCPCGKQALAITWSMQAVVKYKNSAVVRRVSTGCNRVVTKAGLGRPMITHRLKLSYLLEYQSRLSSQCCKQKCNTDDNHFRQQNYGQKKSIIERTDTSALPCKWKLVSNPTNCCSQGRNIQPVCFQMKIAKRIASCNEHLELVSWKTISPKGT